MYMDLICLRYMYSVLCMTRYVLSGAPLLVGGVEGPISFSLFFTICAKLVVSGSNGAGRESQLGLLFSHQNLVAVASRTVCLLTKAIKLVHMKREEGGGEEEKTNHLWKKKSFFIFSSPPGSLHGCCLINASLAHFFHTQKKLFLFLLLLPLLLPHIISYNFCVFRIPLHDLLLLLLLEGPPPSN